jgi:hypothetical protein
VDVVALDRPVVAIHAGPPPALATTTAPRGWSDPTRPLARPQRESSESRWRLRGCRVFLPSSSSSSSSSYSSSTSDPLPGPREWSVPSSTLSLRWEADPSSSLSSCSRPLAVEGETGMEAPASLVKSGSLGAAPAAFASMERPAP